MPYEGTQFECLECLMNKLYYRYYYLQLMNLKIMCFILPFFLSYLLPLPSDPPSSPPPLPLTLPLPTPPPLLIVLFLLPTPLNLQKGGVLLKGTVTVRMVVVLRSVSWFEL